MVDYFTAGLSLIKLSPFPPQVHDCVVESLAGVQQAIQWLVEQTNRR